MSLFAISDLHLSLSADKSMEIFPGWDNYVEKIRMNWTENVRENDIVVIPGDISWGMNLEQAKKDIEFIDSLPGKKIFLKGNHDYWWTTMRKMRDFLEENSIKSIDFIHNNCFEYEKYALCGSRGWINDSEEVADIKVIHREAGRLEMSIKCALSKSLEPIVFLHYPPIYGTDYNYEILEVMHKYNIKDCYYGHIHGKSSDYAITGKRDGIKYTLVSCDYLQFKPIKIY